MGSTTFINDDLLEEYRICIAPGILGIGELISFHQLKTGAWF
jgi:hypothetical protein